MPLGYKIVTVIIYIGDKNKIFEIQKCLAWKCYQKYSRKGYFVLCLCNS